MRTTLCRTWQEHRIGASTWQQKLSRRPFQQAVAASAYRVGPSVSVGQISERCITTAISHQCLAVARLVQRDFPSTPCLGDCAQLPRKQKNHRTLRFPAP